MDESKLATMIHYPSHWDTAAYPTLESALIEVLSDFACSECEVRQIDFGDERN